MPIYEYVCSACGHSTEVFQSIRDQPLTRCQQCTQPTLQKLVSAAGFRLKGGGWYETDFKAAGDKKKNLAQDSNSAESTTPTTNTTAATTAPNNTPPSSSSNS
jgi:putative FmdB family regulatory protein